MKLVRCGGGWLVFLMVLAGGCLPKEVSVTVTRETMLPTVTTAVTAVPSVTTEPSVSPTLSSTPTLNPTGTAVPSATPESTATPSPGPLWTRTRPPISPIAVFPSLTPTATYATKTVFMAVGVQGGDGASFHNYLSAPEIVVYTDGQIVWKEGDFGSGFLLMESTISTAEMCTLLSQFRDSGFFEETETIYAFDETTWYSEGASNYTIQINGPRLGYQKIYEPYVPYLVESVATGFNLLLNYRPANAQPYVPSHLVLSIYQPAADAITDWVTPEPWPAELPPLDQLRPDSTTYKVPIEGELLGTIINLFGQNRLYNDHWFLVGDKLYYLIVRPLLPHETAENLSADFGQPVSIELPFTCDDPTLLAVTPASH